MHFATTAAALSLLLLGRTHEATSAVVRYDWNITTLDPAIFDGVRGAFGYGINNETCDKHPIDVIFGDEVEVHVTNQLNEVTCMHWHGLKQLGTQEMDGVSGITQCQIQPNVTAIYRFTPDKCGSFWYHGHEEVQYAYGLRGALLVHCPEERQQSWEADVEEEYTVVIGDWYHDLPAGAPIWDSVVINNVGRYDCAVAQAAGLECIPALPLPRFQFAPGKKYLLRLINVSALAAFKVSIDGHTFQVVASDADYLEPSTPVNSVLLNVGQRYDVLVEALSTTSQEGDQQLQQVSQTDPAPAALGSYWLRVNSLFGPPWTAALASAVPEGFNPDAFAIIDYDSNATADPTTSAWPTEVAIGEFDYNPAEPVELPAEPDQRIIIEFTLAVLPINPGQFLGYVSINEGAFSSLVTPDVPPLFSIAQGASTEDLPVTANAVRINHNEHIEVVVVNETPDQHPFHLHVHSPWIVGSGRASRDAIIAGNLQTLRLDGPMQHDVFTVPECLTDTTGACTDMGYVVFRINGDNPGVWLMHCHIDWHFVVGLSMLFVEAEDVLHEEGLAAFSPNMLLSVCNRGGNFTI
uniref:Laccase n=1 Tax=Peronospora matthiolae TaxID=2874970 RepID=A0AAV1U7F4_9STRA